MPPFTLEQMADSYFTKMKNQDEGEIAQIQLPRQRVETAGWGELTIPVVADLENYQVMPIEYNSLSEDSLII